MAKIFVIEDDENIRNLIKMALEGNGYQVEAFENAEDAIAVIDKVKPDLAICDLMLPGIDGLEAIKKIRRMPEIKDMLLMILTAKGREFDKVTGLDCGADDYMTKPFGIMELSARIRSLLRRTPQKEEHPQQLFINGMQIDTGAREVLIDGRNVELTYREFELLMYLYQNNQRVVSRDELLDKLWGYDCDVETRTVDIHIGTLRKKLGDEGSESIKTVRNVGYRLISFDQ